MTIRFSLANGIPLCLRPPTTEDIPHLFEAALASRGELVPWMPWCHANYSISDAENWVRETTAADNERSFIIWDEAKEFCLGTCGLNDIQPRHRRANLGYWVHSSHVGQGIATGATLQLAAYAFAELKLVRVEIVAAVGNLPSQRVAEKAGATREGIIRNGLLSGEQPLDAVLFSLIPEDLSPGAD